MKLENVYFGAKCSVILEEERDKLTQQEIHSFRVNCLNVYIECAHQIFTRFPFNSNYIRNLKYLKFLDRRNIQQIQSLAPAAKAFEQMVNIDIVSLDREWRVLRNTEIQPKEDTIIGFWREVKRAEKGDSSEAFPTLTGFVSFILLFLTVVPVWNECLVP